MKNKVTFLMIFLVFFGSSVFSQTASLPTTTASPGETVTIPITVTGWTNIGSIMLSIQIDPTILSYAALSGGPAGMLGGVTGSTLTLSYSGPPYVTIADGGVLVNILFTYNGPGTSPLNFLPAGCEVIQMPGFIPLTVAYTNGQVSPYLGNSTKATLLDQACAVTGATVSVPIKYEGFGTNVGSITQKVQYDVTKMTYVSVTNVGNLTGAFANASGGIVTIAWENTSGANINYPDNQFILNFTYIGTSGTTLEFYPGCIITTNAAVNIPVSYFNGVVTWLPTFAAGTIAESQTLCSGIAADVLTSTGPTGGSSSYLRQWQNSLPGGPWSDISGATLTTYDPGVLTTTTLFRQTQTDASCGFTGNTNEVTITMYNPFTPGTIAASQTICTGATPDPLTTGTPPTGSGTFTYQWQTSLPAGTWEDITGATGTGYAPGALTTTTLYRKNVLDVTCDNTGSTDPVTITVPVFAAGTIAASQTICNGAIPDPLTTDIPPTGSGTYTYQWQSSLPAGTWEDIAGATGTSYAPGALTTTTLYRKTVTDVTCDNTGNTNELTITVYPAFTAGTIAVSQTICNGATPEPLTTEVPPTGSGTYTYQWQTSLPAGTWEDIAGATGTGYAPGALTTTTLYRKTVTDVTCDNTGNTNELTITVYPAFTAGTIAASQTICNGAIPEPLTTEVPPTGSGTYTYQWQTSLPAGTWEDIAGATGTSYAPGALTTTTLYRKTVTDVTCDNTGNTNELTITVYPAFTAGTIAASQTICNGAIPEPLTTEVPPTGSGTYTYQWQSSLPAGTWEDIAGATGTGYAPGALTTTTLYRKTVTDVTCDNTGNTNELTITVYPAFTAGTIAVSQTICNGAIPEPLTTEVPPTGSGTYTYQWQSSLPAGTWEDIAGATGTGYAPGALTTTTLYRKTVTDVTCDNTGNTNELTITVYPAFTAGTIAASQTICNGAIPEPLTTEVPPTGSGTYTYQWQSSLPAGTWEDIAGATGTGYAPGALTTTTLYRKTVTDVTCDNTGNTNELTITVYPAFTAGTIAVSQTICNGATPEPLTTEVPPTGSGTYTYQWQTSLPAGTWEDIAGATGTGYAPGALTTTTLYRKTVTDVTCDNTGNTNELTITVYPAFTAGTIAVSQTICNGAIPEPLTTEVPPTGSGTYTYQWQSSLPAGTWEDIAGATGTGYAPGALTTTTLYRKTVTDVTCDNTGNTNELTITVYPAFTAGTIAASQTICNGATPEPLTTEVPPTGSGTYTYQWQTSLPAGTWEDIAGATGTGYAPGALTTTTLYRKTVTDVTCDNTGNTNELTITVYPAFTAGTIAVSQTICNGAIPEPLTTEVPPTGSGTYTYQWQSSLPAGTWEDIAGATGTGYAPGALTTTTLYRKTVTDVTCDNTGNTNELTITVYPAFTAGTIAASQTICNGAIPEPLTTEVPPTGSGTYTYQWQSSLPAGTWEDIAGATGTGYAPGALTTTTLYRKTVTDVTCNNTGNTNELTITVYPAFTAGTIAASQTICNGAIPEPLTTEVPPTGSGTYTYQWQTSLPAGTWEDIAGATGTGYAPGALTTTTLYRKTVTDVTCDNTGNTNELTITVYPAFTAGTIAASQTICNGAIPEPLTTEVPPTGSGTYTYQWQTSLPAGTWEDIAGATGTGYAPGALTTTTLYRKTVTDVTCDNTGNTNELTITVYPAFTAGTIAASQTICNGAIPEPLTTEVPPTGSGTYTYQWQTSLPAGTWEDIAGATGTGYAPGALTTTTLYRKTVTDVTCDNTGNTNELTITVYPAFTAGTIAVSQTICNGATPEPLTTEVPPTGSGTYTYQWQTSLPAGTWEDIAGATGTGYAPGALTTTTLYRKTVTDVTCDNTGNTNELTITVYPAFTAGTIAASQTICNGAIPEPLTTEVPPTGSGTYTYQWQTSLPAGTWEDIAGATGTSYAPGALTTTTLYRKTVTDVTCDNTGNTNELTITVYPAFTAGTIAASQTICNGAIPEPLTTEVPPTGSGTYTYQWQSSLPAGTWEDIAGATGTGYAPGALTTTTLYRKTVTDVTCDNTGNTNELTITVYPAFTAGTIAVSQTICNGATPEPLTTEVPPTGSGTYTYQWQTSLPAGTWEDIAGATGTGYAPGALTTTTLYRKTVTDVTCDNTGNTNELTITVYPAFTAGTIAASQTICNGAIPEPLTTEVPPTGSGTYTYQWQSSLPAGTWEDIAGATGTSYAPGALTTTTLYRKTVTDVTCDNTGNTNEVTITVNESPVATASNNGPLCEGSTLELTGGPDGMTTYAWTGPNGFTSDVQNPSIPNVTTDAAGVYTLTVTNSLGCTGTANTTVVINANPVATASNNGPLCAGATLNLTGGPDGMATYAWTGPNGFTSDVQNPSITNVTVAATGEYILTVTSTAGCTGTANTTVVINANPVATASNNGPLCAGATLNLTGGPDGMTTYAWTGPNGFSSDVQNPSITNVTVAATGDYTLIVTNSFGCTGTAITSVVVNATPVATASNNGPLCAGATLNLTGGPSGMTTYAWTGPNGFTSNLQNPSIPNVTVAAAGVYNLIVTNSFGCTGSASTTVVINANPTATASNNGPLCVGATLNLTGGPDGMTTYAWTGPNGFTSNVQNPTIPNVTVAAAGVYNLTVTNASGCTGTANTTVVVNPNPVATASNNGPMCEGLTLNLTGGPSGMASYAWTGPNGFTSNVQNPTIPNVTVAAAGVYNLTVTSTSGCTGTANTTVVIYATPVATAANNGPMCEGLTLNLYGGPSGMTSYSWTGPNGFTSNVQNPTIPNVTAAASGEYFLTVSNAYGCSSSASTWVTINANPAATAANNGPLCEGATLNLTGGPDGMASYAWTGPNGFTSDVQNPSITNVTTDAAGVYTLNVTSTSGCSASANTTVVVNPIPEAPVITEDANVLTSSAPLGNQWYYSETSSGTGDPIPGATGQTHVAQFTGWYWTIVTLEGCASPESNHLYVVIIGQQELTTSESYVVYPVPNDGQFTASIRYPVEDNFTITVYNQLGSKVFELRDVTAVGGKYDTQIDLRPLANGIYSVVFQNNVHKVVRKILVKK